MLTEISDEQIEKAREAMKWLAENPAARRLADAEEMQRRDMVSRIEGAFMEGFRIGFEESILRVRQNGALKLLRRKVPHREIADVTGLSVDEIRHLENGSPSQ